MYNSKNSKSLSNRLKTTNFKKWLFLAGFLLLIASTFQCASVQRPTGGPKDSIPPKLLQESPPNLTRNFDAEKITISFDEFIKLTNEFKEISVSPDMETLPRFRVKRRNLEVTMPDSLEENTTYTINFGKAIGDYNENNTLDNYTYVFSTGDVIDSLSISGNVTNAFTKEPEIGINVLLIPTRQDSIFGKRKANIFALTDSSGNFKMNYLREDTYRIYALREKNVDRIYNLPDEYIGFLRDSIVLTGDTSNIKLETFREVPKTVRIINRLIEPSGRVLLTFNRPLTDPKLSIVSPRNLDDTKITRIGSKRDSAMIWLANHDFDSLKVHVLEADTLIDSLTLRKGRNDKYDPDFELVDNIKGNKINRIHHLKLSASTPINRIDRSKIVLMEDSTAIPNYQLIKDTTTDNTYLLRYNWRVKRNYSLKVEEGGFLGFFEEKNKSFQKAFTLDEEQNFGDIILDLRLPDTNQHIVVEIIDEKKETVFYSIPVQESRKLTIKNLPGGKYGVRIIYDDNRNGKWDTGDLAQKRFPEQIWYFDKTFMIRANWEQEEIIKIPPK